MFKRSDASHHYRSAHKRFLKKSIENFFKQEFPRTFGPTIRASIADSLIQIYSDHFKEKELLKTGQILWNAVHKDTRADFHNVKFVPVVLTMINDEDITNLENGMKVSEHKQNVIARITQEAYEQGALLSTRDISLLMATHIGQVSCVRSKYERRNNITLPHTGNLHDMGSCITHKYQIIYKYVVEKKDSTTVAKETHHTLKAVEHYLKDFNRVKTLYFDNKNVDYIHMVTGMSINLIKQYVNIIDQYVIEPKGVT